MGAEGAATILRCAECERSWLPEDAEHWSDHLTDDEPPEVVFYCPDCNEREFGGNHTSAKPSYNPADGGGGEPLHPGVEFAYVACSQLAFE